MVVQTDALTDDQVDALFRALADRTRRDIVARVIHREQSVSALAERYEMSFAAVQKHVSVLERASLVSKRRRGREQIVTADRDAVRLARKVLDSYEALWRHRADQITALLAEG
ncbi:ArsR family transcriptional regulator [Microcella alkaliphila]|uniref:ArsR family transcriptional regulator n=1 Tax=Microcella alkaliphila TaxID=279828 RepID=A0A4V6MCF2_9MICO|nr:metalloregulator ArsR/SmtB family transcription factor [Microcella alkaliphila]RZT64359.1 ArsR family transcriptional regulator [Microcella alkaliphila]